MSPEAKKTPRSRAASTATKAASAKPSASVKAPTNGTYRKPEYTGLRQRYHDDIVPAMQREFTYANPMQIPRVEKIVVNIGLGEAIANAKALDAAVGDLTTITGQKPIVTRAKKLDRAVPAAHRDADRRQGDAARPAHVRLPRAHYDARAAPHPRLPRHPDP